MRIAAPAYDPSMAKRPVRMTRVLRNGARDDGSFDIEFWRRVGAEGRFAAVWQMACEADAIRGCRVSVNPDFRDLFFELNAAEARFLVALRGSSSRSAWSRTASTS